MAAENFFIYRLPGENEATGFKNSILMEGAAIDAFVIAPFDPSRHATVSIPVGEPISVNELNKLAASAYKADKLKNYQSPISTTEEEHASMIASAVEAMQAGKLDKCVISRTIVKEGRVDVAKTFEALCRRYPNAYVFCFFTPRTGVWLGASPERLLRFYDGRLDTMALAGTKPADDPTPWDWKNLEEHQIVTDYISREFSRLDIPHSVAETETVKAGPVQHLHTLITSDTQTGGNISSITAMELARRLSPTPALSGFPKTEAMNLISSLEKTDRTYYGGYFGFRDIWGNFDFYVNLRSIRLFADGFCLRSGGGIMPDSHARDEWEETERKSYTILDCVRLMEQPTKQKKQ